MSGSHSIAVDAAETTRKLFRGLKNLVGYEEVENLVRNSTSNTADPPTTQQLMQIRETLLYFENYPKMFAILWRRLCHLEYKRHVYKALIVLDYLIRLKPPSRAVQLRLIVDTRERWNDLFRLAKLPSNSTSETIRQIQRVAERLCDFILRFERGEMDQNQDEEKEEEIQLDEEKEQQDDEKIKKKKKKKKGKKKKKSHSREGSDASGSGSGSSAAHSENEDNENENENQNEPAAAPVKAAPANPFGFDFLNLDQKLAGLDFQPLSQPAPPLSPRDPFADLPRSVESWKCTVCGIQNPLDRFFCPGCQSPRSSDGASPSHAHAAAAPAALAPWNCNFCSFLNSGEATHCAICENDRHHHPDTHKSGEGETGETWETNQDWPKEGMPNQTAPEEKKAPIEEEAKPKEGAKSIYDQEREIPNLKSISGTLRNPRAMLPGAWACAHCSWLNPPTASHCEVCDREGSKSVLANQVKLEFARKTEAKTSKNLSWSCSRCSNVNPAYRSQCAACGQKAPGEIAAKQQPQALQVPTGLESPRGHQSRQSIAFPPNFSLSLSQDGGEQDKERIAGGFASGRSAAPFQPQVIGDAAQASSPSASSPSGGDGDLLSLVNEQQRSLVHQLQALEAFQKQQEMVRAQSGWTCSACTFINGPRSSKCEMCETEKDQAPGAGVFSQPTSRSHSRSNSVNSSPTSQQRRISQQPAPASASASPQPVASQPAYPRGSVSVSPPPTTIQITAPNVMAPRGSIVAPSGPPPALPRSPPTAAMGRRASINQAPGQFQPPAAAQSAASPSLSPLPGPAVAAPSPSKPLPWNCERCTFENEPDSLLCSICDAPPPASSHAFRALRGEFERPKQQQPAAQPPQGLAAPSSGPASVDRRSLSPEALRAPDERKVSAPPAGHRSSISMPPQPAQPANRSAHPGHNVEALFSEFFPNSPKSSEPPKLDNVGAQQLQPAPGQHARAPSMGQPQMPTSSPQMKPQPQVQAVPLSQLPPPPSYTAATGQSSSQPVQRQPTRGSIIAPGPSSAGPSAAQSMALPPVAPAQKSPSFNSFFNSAADNFGADFVQKQGQSGQPQAQAQQQPTQKTAPVQPQGQTQGAAAAAVPQDWLTADERAIIEKHEREARESKDTQKKAEAEDLQKKAAEAQKKAAAEQEKAEAERKAREVEEKKQREERERAARLESLAKSRAAPPPPPPAPPVPTAAQIAQAQAQAQAQPAAPAEKPPVPPHPKLSAQELERRVSGAADPPSAGAARSSSASSASSDKSASSEPAMTKRERVCAELISTEKYYLGCLQDTISHYLDPLKKNSSKWSVSDKQIAAIFSNLPIIAQFHQMFYAELAKNKNIPSVFLKFADFLKMYTQYLNEYEKSIATINALRTNKQFQKFLNETREKLNGNSLMSMLIMPVQRIPRFSLLLREMRKNTPADHPESDQLDTAIAKVELIAQHLNESKRHVENMSKLLDIQNRLKKNEFVLFKPDRRLLKEGLLKRVKEEYLMDRTNDKPKPNDLEDTLFFLFNDLLLWTSTEFAMLGSVPVATLLVLNDSYPHLPFVLSLGVKGKPFCPDMTWSCSEKAEKDEWSRYISSAILSQTDSKGKRKMEESAAAAEPSKEQKSNEQKTEAKSSGPAQAAPAPSWKLFSTAKEMLECDNAVNAMPAPSASQLHAMNPQPAAAPLNPFDRRASAISRPPVPPMPSQLQQHPPVPPAVHLQPQAGSSAPQAQAPAQAPSGPSSAGPPPLLSAISQRRASLIAHGPKPPQ